MPNQHNLHNHQIAVKFPHPVWRQIEKRADESRLTPGQYIRDVVTLQVADVPLTAADAKIIAERLAAAEHAGRMQ